MLGYGAGKNAYFAESLRLPKLGQPLLRQLQCGNERPGYGATAADLGIAVVIVNHLRKTATLLHEILPHYTQMPVTLISEGLHIKPNGVFIIPPQRDLHVLNGEFLLRPISKPRGWPDVITVFLRSMAQHWEGKLIAVIVSGFDGDGADALCEIRGVGGVTIAQKLDTASEPDMPTSAIASGCIDYILSPEDIAVKLREITRANLSE